MSDTKEGLEIARQQKRLKENEIRSPSQFKTLIYEID